jgi:hypothetical protein
MISDEEWVSYLKEFSPEMRAFALINREMTCTLLEHERSRFLTAQQTTAREIARLKERANVLHQTVEDLIADLSNIETRVYTLEHPQEREHGGGR